MSRTAPRTVLLILAVVAWLSSARTGHSEWYTFQEYGGHFYTTTDGAKTWIEAEAEANSLNGHLVAVGSSEEHAWLVSTFLVNSDPQPPVYWIGLTDDEAFGGSESYGTANPQMDGWVWTNGEAVSFTNWNDARATGGDLEPNDYLGIEDYVAMNWHYVMTDPRDHVDIMGTWNDFPATGSGDMVAGPYLGIIELDSNPVPEPSSLGLCVSLATVAFFSLRRPHR